MEIYLGELHEKWNCIRVSCYNPNCERTNEERWNYNSRGGMRNSRNQMFSTVSAENIAIMMYFSTSDTARISLFDGCALLASLGRVTCLSIKLNIMYYECRHHYNPILNVKAAAEGYCVTCNVGYRKDRGHRCTDIREKL